MRHSSQNLNIKIIILLECTIYISLYFYRKFWRKVVPPYYSIVKIDMSLELQTFLNAFQAT
jgi:hypothetical protein